MGLNDNTSTSESSGVPSILIGMPSVISSENLTSKFFSYNLVEKSLIRQNKLY